MKIAILIGISNYKKLQKLPACVKDLHLMSKVINATKKYDDVLSISDKDSSSNAKRKISDFISKYHTKKEIDEAFFYYTGHGEFYDNEFYYPLCDFDSSNRKLTSLENSELDSLLRSLKPKLTIKVVDACNSGISYIKDDSEFDNYITKTQNLFDRCYFMFSSKLDQASYQDEDLSLFTRSFLKSLRKEQNERIRYKDIMDYISDRFSEQEAQTPTFVTQSTMTEDFCIINKEIKKIVDELYKSNTTEDAQKTDVDEVSYTEDTEPKTLVDIVKEEAIDYCTASEAKETIKDIEKHVKDFKYNSDIEQLLQFAYTPKTKPSYENLPKEAVIGNWLHKSGDDFFTESIIEEEAYDVEVRDMNPLTMHITGGIRTKTNYRKKITGFKNTANTGYNIIEIKGEPNYLNVPPFNCTIVILLSKRLLVFFYFFTQYREKNWSERELLSDVKWNYSTCKLKNKEEIYDATDRIQEGFSSFINGRLEEQFGYLEI